MFGAAGDSGRLCTQGTKLLGKVVVSPILSAGGKAAWRGIYDQQQVMVAGCYVARLWYKCPEAKIFAPRRNSTGRINN